MPPHARIDTDLNLAGTQQEFNRTLLNTLQLHTGDMRVLRLICKWLAAAAHDLPYEWGVNMANCAHFFEEAEQVVDAGHVSAELQLAHFLRPRECKHKAAPLLRAGTHTLFQDALMLTTSSKFLPG